MGLLWAFSPFIAFAVLNHFVNPTMALVVAALVSLVLIGREIASGRSAKILEIGTCILFAGLAAFSYFSDMNWPVVGVKLAVDAGLIAIVLVSLIMGRPFTLQYAREQVPNELWDSPEFFRINQVITLVWLGAFAVLIFADLILLYVPEAPHRISVLLTIAALYGAFKFTTYYPDRKR